MAKKSYTLTGSDKIKRKHAYKSHILTRKTSKEIKRRFAIRMELQPEPGEAPKPEPKPDEISST